MGVRERQKWITGEEFGAERRRLMSAGKKHDSPEMKALFQRVDDRDDEIWATYAGPLIEEYPGQWAAISLDGESLVRSTSSAAASDGRERFGPGNFVFGRLAAFRGFQM